MMFDYPQMNRRHFLKHMAGLSLMALPSMHFLQGLRAAAPELKAKGKSLIILWMSGGPTTIDLWDLKPGSNNGGDHKPIKTSADGMEITEHMPIVASQGKNINIVRSLSTTEGDHNRGTILMNTGRTPSPVVNYPHIGSVVSQQLTSKDLDLPGFISVGGNGQRIGPGFLGMMYAPFTVQNPGQPPANIRPPQEMAGDTDRIRRRQRLFYSVEDQFNSSMMPHKSESEQSKSPFASQAHSDIYGKAFSLVVSPRGKVFDLKTEDPKLVEEYGNNNFGRGCLLARKLVEAGVTAVEVDLGGWDMHANIFNTLATQRLPVLDKGMGTLVKDLAQRGSLKNTVVVWMGEFGRTPRINQNTGRDHWARCWSVVVAGGNTKGGVVHGETNADGTDVKDGKVNITDLYATIYKAMGIDPTTPIRDNLGRPSPLAGDGAKVISSIV